MKCCYTLFSLNFCFNTFKFVGFIQEAGGNSCDQIIGVGGKLWHLTAIIESQNVEIIKDYILDEYRSENVVSQTMKK